MCSFLKSKIAKSSGQFNMPIVLGVLGVLNVLNVLHVLHVLDMPMDASLACWALFFTIEL